MILSTVPTCSIGRFVVGERGDSLHLIKNPQDDPGG